MGSPASDHVARVNAWLHKIPTPVQVTVSPRKRQKLRHSTWTKLPTPSDSDSNSTTSMAATPPRNLQARLTGRSSTGDGPSQSIEEEQLDDAALEQTPRALTAGVSRSIEQRLSYDDSFTRPDPSSKKRKRQDGISSPSPTRSAVSLAARPLPVLQARESASQASGSLITSEAESSPERSELSRVSSRNEYAIPNLSDFDPPIDVAQIANWLHRPSSRGTQRKLPPAVQKLYTTLGRVTQELAIIPFAVRSELEARLSNAGQGDFLPSDEIYKSSGADSLMTAAALWRAVSKVCDMQLSGLVKNETNSVMSVVNPLLEVVAEKQQQLSQSKGDVRVNVLNLQSTYISDPCWIPRLEDVPPTRSTGRMIDLALSLPQSLTRDQGRALRHQWTTNKSLNQTKEPYHMEAMFAYIEVKTSKSRDPRSQLAVWAASGHLKARAHGWDLSVPRVGITVVGDVWEAWLIFWDEDDEGLAVLGPYCIGTTTGELAVFRLLHVLRAITEWGTTEFRELYQKGVIDRLVGGNETNMGGSSVLPQEAPLIHNDQARET